MVGIRLSGIIENTLTNGKGNRLAIFFQGCPHHCDGCHNEHTWDPKGGELKSHKYVQDLIVKNLPIIDGITLTGGEPLSQPADARLLAEFAKSKGLNVWLYTGYEIDEAIGICVMREIIEHLDVIVEGKFVKELANPELNYRGSSNQRLFDVDGKDFPSRRLKMAERKNIDKTY